MQEAPGNPCSALPVSGDPQSCGFFLNGKDKIGRHLCNSTKQFHDAWDDVSKQDKEGEFLACVCACVCVYIFTHICTCEPRSVALCQKA